MAKSIASAVSFISYQINSLLFERKDFRTTRKIVVFESDDWGSIRMSNKKDWDSLRKLGYAVDKRPYERFDTLESAEDLEALFDVLRKYKDCNGNHPIITANMLMANPDFEKIEQSGFLNYYFEPIAETYKHYFGDSKVLDMLRQGYEEGIIMPQSHGREHFNVTQWMRGLQSNDEDLMTAFKYGMCGIAPKNHPEQGNQLMNALLAIDEPNQKEIEKIVVEGLNLFEQLWGFHSQTFVAPCYCWNERIEQVLYNENVKLIQTSRINKKAYCSPKRYFYSGMHTDGGLLYSIRNCVFEPATVPGKSDVDALMAQIENVFKRNRIAVISTHRINYVGGIDINNRDKTLHLLQEFLTRLLKKYPNVEFMSSEKLIKIFEQ